MSDTLKKIRTWFSWAFGNLSRQDEEAQAAKQLGCELATEIMLIRQRGSPNPTAISLSEALSALGSISSQLKKGELAIDVKSRLNVADAIGDIVVTLVGFGYLLDMDIATITERINESNWSKFEDGKPVFDAYGKIAKGRNYTPPKLEDLV
jgi:hypothetical protein